MTKYITHFLLNFNQISKINHFFHFRNLADQLQAVVSEMGTTKGHFVRMVSYGQDGEITIVLYDENWIEDMVNQCNDETINPSGLCLDR